MKKRIFAITLIMALAFAVTGCTEETYGTIAQQESTYQENLMQQAADEVGMPNITEFYEKKLAAVHES